MRSTLVTDTGVVYAALVRSDRHHSACAGLLGSGQPVVIPNAVLVEAGLLGFRRGQPRVADQLLGSVLDRSVELYDTDHEDHERIRDLMRQYADLPLDLVDATVVAVAERLEEDTIATLDRRHFSVVKPLHCEAFTLVP